MTSALRFPPSRVALALLLAALGGYWLHMLVAFAAVLPGHDFVGDTYWVDYFARELGAGRLPYWSAADALGHPITLQRATILLFLPVVGLKAVCGDTVVAAKIWFALLHTLSFVTFFGLARRYGATRTGAAMGAFAYLLAPMHTFEVATAGHWQLAVTFFLAPWILSSLLALLREPNAMSVARVALLLAWSVLADSERLVTLLPVYAGACALEVADLRALGRTAQTRRLGALAAAASLALAITAWATLPALMERAGLNVHGPTGPRAASLFPHHSRYLRGPLYVLDHGWWLGATGPHDPNAQGHHAGWLLAGVGSVAVGLAAFRHERRALLGVLALVSIWIATWNAAWCGTPGTRIAGALLLLAVAGLAAWRGGWSQRATLVGAATLALLLFVPSSAIFGRVAPFAMIANKLWFVVVALPLVLSLLVSSVVSESARWPARTQTLFAIGAVALAACDAIAWVPKQTSYPADLQARLTHALAPLAADPAPSRYLPYPYAESEAVDAFALRFAPKPSASSWLLWATGRWGAERIALAYAELDGLERMDGEAAAHALDRAASINVRYLVVPPSRVAGLLRPGLLARVGDGDPAVLENLRWRGDVSVTSNGAPVAYSRPSDEAWKIDHAARGEIVLAEAWYPYWRATVGGVSKPTHPSADGLIAIDVDTDGPVTVAYEPPGIYRLFGWLSAGALLLALAALALTATSLARPRSARA